MLVIEKDIESYLIKRVEEYGGMCLKYPTIHTEGIPDRLVIMPVGRVAFVELKRPKGGRLSEIQKYQIGKLEELGVEVAVLKNKADVDEFIAKSIPRNLSAYCVGDEAECMFFDDNKGCRLPYGWTCKEELKHELR